MAWTVRSYTSCSSSLTPGHRLRSRQHGGRALPRAMSVGSACEQALEDADCGLEFFHIRRAEQWFAEERTDWFVDGVRDPHDRVQVRVAARIGKRAAECDVRDAGVLGDEVVLVAFALDDLAQALAPIGHDRWFRSVARSRMKCAV